MLQPLDKLQDRFVREAGLTSLEALMVFNLAPLSCRRDVAMLGILHRAALKKGPPQFWQFFKPDNTAVLHWTRTASRRHGRHLVETRRGRFLEVLRRSALGQVAVYNLLPHEVVAESIVKQFQRKLRTLLEERASSGAENWQATFSPREPLWRHPLR